MVGVPGRSKGCRNCKERKKRVCIHFPVTLANARQAGRLADCPIQQCDQQKPSCIQCSRLGLECLGYERETIFIAAHGIPKEDSWQARETLRASRQKTTAEVTPLTQALTNGHPSGSRLDLLRQSPPVLEWCPSPSRAYRQQLLRTYISKFSPSQGARYSESILWITLLPAISHRSLPLEAVCMALCTGRLGRDDGNQQLTHNSLRFYTQALRGLRQDLSNPDAVYKDETLGACMALAMYEFLEVPLGTHEGYDRHHAASGKLIRLRGPEAHASGPGHHLFLSYRARDVCWASL